MENSTLEYRVKVMQAYLDGRTIEYDKFNNHYEDCQNPDFNWQFHNYRIKDISVKADDKELAEFEEKIEKFEQKLAKKLLSVFGYTNDSFGTTTEKEAINEIFNLDAGSNPLTLLEMFLLRVSDKDMKELKEIVSE